MPCPTDAMQGSREFQPDRRELLVFRSGDDERRLGDGGQPRTQVFLRTSSATPETGRQSVCPVVQTGRQVSGLGIEPTKHGLGEPSVKERRDPDGLQLVGQCVVCCEPSSPLGWVGNPWRGTDERERQDCIWLQHS